MGRIYSENLFGLPRVDVPDWELLGRIEELAKPYLPPTTYPPPPRWFAQDDRGSYDAPDLGTFRREVEAQEQLPLIVRMTFAVIAAPVFNQTAWSINVYTSRIIGTGGRVESTDEAFVNHVSARLRDIFSAAAGRSQRSPERPPSSSEMHSQREERALSRRARDAASAHAASFMVGTTTTVIGGAILIWLFGG